MSLTHWAIVAGLAVLLFGGGGKLSALMGDFAKGIKSFKRGLADEGAGDGADLCDVDRLTEQRSEPLLLPRETSSERGAA